MHPGAVTLRSASGAEDLRAAADVWARATARRDDSAPPRSGRDVLDGLQDRMRSSGAVLTFAERTGPEQIGWGQIGSGQIGSGRDGSVVGFSIVLADGPDLEVVYLATDPDAWGLGTASLLLREIDALALRRGATDMTLWVIADNARAIGVYERAGWERTAATRAHPTSPVEERRLVRTAPAREPRT